MTGNPTHWLYPIQRGSGYWFAGEDGKPIKDPDTGRPDTSVAAFRASVQVRDRDQWYLNSGFHQMKPDDLIWVYAGAPEQAVIGLGRAAKVGYYPADDSWYVDIVWDREACAALERAPIPRQNFRVVPRSPAIRPGPQHSGIFDNWLNQQHLESRRKPAGTSLADLGDEDARVRVVMEVTRRQGQGPFREDLLRAYARKCAISECDVEKVLEAAHIRPYSGPNSNRVANGLLLRSDLHTLFDLRLLTIDSNYRVIVAESVRRGPYDELHGKHLRLPAAKDDWPSTVLLEKHRQAH